MGKRPGGDGMVLEVSFTSGQMAKTCSTAALMQRKWGALRAKKMHLRLGQMTAAANLAELMTLPQARCHQLGADRDEQFSLDLDGPYRLIVEVDHDPVPRRDDGGVDLDRVTRLIVIEVADTH